MLFTQSKKIWLKKSRLYLVLDTQVNGPEDLLRVASEAASCGVDVVQLRDKFGSVKDVVSLTSKILKRIRGRVPVIINDRIDVAYEVGADGVHLGQDDLSVKTAQKILGSRAIVGRSCQTLMHARAAVREGADYLGFGSVFKTQTKPERSPMDLNVLQRVVREIPIPVFAIGGITVENIGRLKTLGVDRVAVTRAISCAKNIADAVKDLKQ